MTNFNDFKYYLRNMLILYESEFSREDLLAITVTLLEVLADADAEKLGRLIRKIYDKIKESEIIH